MSMPSRVKLTEDEYLAIERAAETKSEFYDGVMYAMSGASFPHGRIVVNLTSKLDAQLEGRPCQVISNDLRVDIKATGSYAYPDIVGFCGEPRFRDKTFDTLLNPVLIVEVLSPSTEKFDQGRKFDHYALIASLREYVLVSQERMQVDRYWREDESAGWFFRRYRHPDEILELESIGCAVPLREVYARVELPESAGEPGSSNP